MTKWPHKLTASLTIALVVFVVAIESGMAQPMDSETIPIGIVVTEGGGQATPTSPVDATPTATNEPVTPTSTVPVVSELPETGTAISTPHATGVLMTMLVAGILILTGGLIRTGRADRR